MIEKHTFVDLINIMNGYSNNVRTLEHTFDCIFENWLTQHESDMLCNISRAFFSTNLIYEIDCDENDIAKHQQETVEDLIFNYCYNGDFGKNKQKLIGMYKRGTDVIMDATSPEQLYDVIVDYLTNTDEDVWFNFC